MLARLEQTRQALKEFAVTKIVETAASLCSFDQVRCNHRSRSNARLFQQRTKSIKEANRERRTDLLEGSGRVVHCGSKRSSTSGRDRLQSDLMPWK